MAQQTPIEAIVEEYKDDLHTMLKYEDEFDAKPYYFEYRSVFRFTVFLGFLCSIISIVGGVPFAKDLLEGITPNQWVAGGIGIVLLLSIETGHHLLTPKLIRDWISQNHRVKKVMIIGVLGLRAISMIVTYNGVGAAFDQLNPTAQGLTNVDSIQQAYDTKISAIDSTNSAATEMRWRGSVTKTAQKLMVGLAPQKLLLLEEKKQEVAIARTNNGSLKFEHDDDNETDSKYLGIFVIIIELLMFISIWHQVQYKHQSTMEAKALLKKQQELEEKANPTAKKVKSPSHKKPKDPEEKKEPLIFEMNKNTINVEGFSKPYTISGLNDAISQYNWKLRNGKGKEITNKRNIAKFLDALEALKRRTA